MLPYCLKCRKNTESKNPKVASTKKKIIKQQEASGLLSSLGVKIPLSKFPFVGPLLF